MRSRDLPFEALSEVCGLDWHHLTDSERGRTNAALKQIRDLETQLSDEILAAAIRGHAVAYKQAYPEIPLTPTALANNWSIVIPLAKEKALLRIQANAPATGTDCPECGGDKQVAVTGADGREYAVPCPTCTSPPDELKDAAREAHARRSNPWTSKLAADSLTEQEIRDSQAAVLACFRLNGAMHHERLCEVYAEQFALQGWPGQAVSGLRTRTSELVKIGLVEDTGRTVEMPSKRPSIVWAAKGGPDVAGGDNAPVDRPVRDRDARPVRDPSPGTIVIYEQMELL